MDTRAQLVKDLGIARRNSALPAETKKAFVPTRDMSVSDMELEIHGLMNVPEIPVPVERNGFDQYVSNTLETYRAVRTHVEAMRKSQKSKARKETLTDVLAYLEEQINIGETL